MPYAKISDLPESSKAICHLTHKLAFNHAYEEYKDLDKRQDHSSREEIAHRIAWNAVKKEYEKDGEHWKRKE
jgi:cation transport regulator